MSNQRKLRAFKRLKGIVVLSLFDGMSCGQLALERAGINVDAYYASEVDKYAIQVTQHNYPNTIQIGSVLDITIERISKFEILLNSKYIIDITKLILIGGSPCQGFSFAGNMLGSSTECNIDVTTLDQYMHLKFQDFKFKGQSYLFWEYMRVLRDIKPMYYFLENVKMVKKWKGMFNDALGHEPYIINSALVSAQNRVRLYWTNIPGVVQPEDKGIFIKDILEDVVDEKYYMKQDFFMRNNTKVSSDDSYLITIDKGVHTSKKTSTLLSSYGNKNLMGKFGSDPFIIVGAIRGRYIIDGKRQDHKIKTAGLTTQRLEVRDDEKSNCLTTVQKDNVVIDKRFNVNPSGRGMNGWVYGVEHKSPTITTNKGEGSKILIESKKQLRMMRYCKRNNILVIPEATKQGYIIVKDGECFDYTHPNSTTRRGRSMKDKSNCLTTSHQYMRYEYPRVRKLTPIECERLQTVPDNYTSIVSNSQRYKMLGNGWTVEVPSDIFKLLKR